MGGQGQTNVEDNVVELRGMGSQFDMCRSLAIQSKSQFRDAMCCMRAEQGTRFYIPAICLVSEPDPVLGNTGALKFYTTTQWLEYGGPLSYYVQYKQRHFVLVA